MAKKAYVGVDNVAQKVSRMYIGVDNTARHIIKGYVGVNGVAQQFWPSGAAIPYIRIRPYTMYTPGNYYNINKVPINELDIFLKHCIEEMVYLYPHMNSIMLEGLGKFYDRVEDVYRYVYSHITVQDTIQIRLVGVVEETGEGIPYLDLTVGIRCAQTDTTNVKILTAYHDSSNILYYGLSNPIDAISGTIYRVSVGYDSYLDTLSYSTGSTFDTIDTIGGYQTCYIPEYLDGLIGGRTYVKFSIDGLGLYFDTYNDPDYILNVNCKTDGVMSVRVRHSDEWFLSNANAYIDRALNYYGINFSADPLYSEKTSAGLICKIHYIPLPGIFIGASNDYYIKFGNIDTSQVATQDLILFEFLDIDTTDIQQYQRVGLLYYNHDSTLYDGTGWYMKDILPGSTSQFTMTLLSTDPALFTNASVQFHFNLSVDRFDLYINGSLVKADVVCENLKGYGCYTLRVGEYGKAREIVIEKVMILRRKQIITS